MKTRFAYPTPFVFSKVRPWTGLWTALAGAALLSACLNPTSESDTATPPADVESGIGQALAASFSGAQAWELAADNRMDPELWGRVAVSAELLAGEGAAADLSGAGTLLSKRSSSADDTLDIAVDSSLGLATVAHVYVLLGATVTDSAVIRWDDKAKDTVHDNENIVSFKQIKRNLLGQTEVTVFTDGDGDGLINPTQAGSKVDILCEKSGSGMTETTRLVVGCGPDMDFAGEADNLLFSASWEKRQGDKVMAEAEFADGDGDGMVRASADTSVVELRFKEVSPQGRPLVAELSGTAKIRLFGQDAGDEPVGFSYVETMKSGRINTVTLKNTRGEAEILGDDTLTVTLQTRAERADDTLKNLSVDFVMSLGKNLQSDADDSCYAFHVHSMKKIGLEREAEFHFLPDEPVLHGENPVSGHFEGQITFADGGMATLTGNFSPTGFHTEISGDAVAAGEFDFDLSGEVRR